MTDAERREKDGRESRKEWRERLTLVLAILAFIVSIGSPLAQYFWLQPNPHELAAKARSFSVEGTSMNLRDCDMPKSKQYVRHYLLELKNSGDLEIGDVWVSVQKLRKDDDFVINPTGWSGPLRFRREDKGKEVWLYLEDKLPIRGRVSLQIGEAPTPPVLDDTEDDLIAPIVSVHAEGAGYRDVFFGYDGWTMDNCPEQKPSGDTTAAPK
jgi:hypothetical protein